MVNTDTPLYKGLVNLGFSEKESSVYLALLELGKRTVSPIARTANINRTTVYDILDSLVAKGLVHVSGKEPLQEYVAESPDKIVKLMQEQIDKSQLHLEQAKNLIPQLKSIHNVSARPRIRFYEGTEGLEQVYEDTLTSSETIRGYANVEEMHNGLPEYFPKYYKRRAAKGIHIKALLSSNEAGKKISEKDKEELRDTVFISTSKYKFVPEIDIYDNKVMIASWREKLGIIIESAEIAEAMKIIYDLAWTEAKRLEEFLPGTNLQKE